MSVFDRNSADEFARGARTLIAYPELPGNAVVDNEIRLEEAAGLAAAIGLEVQQMMHLRVRSPKPGTLFGSGQVQTICTAIDQGAIDLLVVDGALSAIQQRNLEEQTKVKVIDRTGLILEIFGERAATAEGRLQVELAHLDYQAGRLVRSWTHLERQRGGFGFLGGPGETQIEADRRMIRDRIARLRRELEQVQRTRGLHRARRQRAPWPVIALVGYTNAGKSTLFNRLTRADVLAEDMLFATLDPTLREIALPGVEKAIMSDTVGFVSDLPTQLVAAFRATLEEVVSADIIIHVRDISHPASDQQKTDVLAILAELGVNATTIFELWNKIDLLDSERRTLFERQAEKQHNCVALSAHSGEGIEALLGLLASFVSNDNVVRTLQLSSGEGEVLAWLHAKGKILETLEIGAIIRVTASLSKRHWGQFEKLFAI